MNGAVAKWAWERYPYRTVPYAEDQLLGREVIEGGLAKVFHPEARVVHSHDFPPLQFFRRYFDEFRSLREVLGHVEALGWRVTPMTIRGLRRARQALAAPAGRPRCRARRARSPCPRATTRCARPARSSARARTDCRRACGKTLSLDGRATFTPSTVEESPLLKRGPEPGSKPVEVVDDWTWGFIRDAYPQRPGDDAGALRAPTPRPGRSPGSCRRGGSAPAATRRSSA